MSASSSTPEIAVEQAINRNPIVVTPETLVSDAIARVYAARATCLLPGICASNLPSLAEAHASCVLVPKDTLLNSFQPDRCHLPIVDEQESVVGVLTQSTLLQTLKLAELHKQVETSEHQVAELEAEKQKWQHQALDTGELQVDEQQLQLGDRIQFEEVRVVKSGEDELLFMLRDISKHKYAVQLLKERLQFLLLSSLAVIFTCELFRDYGITSISENVLELAQTQQPHLILMDIQMPEVDGLEVTQRIRACAKTAHIPIIALTALAMTGDEERCLNAGANAYLTKPVSLKQLVNTIRQIL